jgi:hypothetical protein
MRPVVAQCRDHVFIARARIDDIHTCSDIFWDDVDDDTTFLTPDIPAVTSSNMFVSGRLSSDHPGPGTNENDAGTIPAGTTLTIVSISVQGEELVAQCRVHQNGQWTIEEGVPLSKIETDLPLGSS